MKHGSVGSQQPVARGSPPRLVLKVQQVNQPAHFLSQQTAEAAATEKRKSVLVVFHLGVDDSGKAVAAAECRRAQQFEFQPQSFNRRHPLSPLERSDGPW